MTTGKVIALTRQTFVDEVMSLLFNMLSRLVITFLPRSKHLLISWLQSPSAVILLLLLLLLSRFSHVRLFVTQRTIALQAPLSMGFSRKKYWSGMPCPPPGYLPHPGIEPGFPVLPEDSLPLSTGEA